MSRVLRIVGFTVVIVILLFTGVLGIVDAVDDFGKADTVAKMVYTILLAACGCFGLAAGSAVLSRKSWARILILGWASTMLGVGLTSPLAWGWPGLLPAFAMISILLLIGGLTYYGWQVTAGSKE